MTEELNLSELFSNFVKFLNQEMCLQKFGLYFYCSVFNVRRNIGKNNVSVKGKPMNEKL
jgi:hypothetical protein